MSEDGWEKAPGDVEDFSFSWATWLGVGETITAATVTANDPALTVSNVAHDPTTVTFRVAGGVTSTRYRLTCNISTSTGEQGSDSKSILVRET